MHAPIKRHSWIFLNFLTSLTLHASLLGHGRSAAIVLAWLMSKSEDLDSLDLEMLNSQLCELRDVRKTLFKQPNVNEFRSWLNLSGSRKKRVEIDESSGDEL